MAAIYGSAGIAAFFAFSWRPWAVVFPFIGAAVLHIYVKYQYKKDLYYFAIKKIYDRTADCYQPWSREQLLGRGSRPKGFGRGVRS